MRLSSANELAVRAAANGYKRWAHQQEDQLTGQGKHVKSVLNNQDKTLRRYVMWHLANMTEDYAQRDLPPPTEEVAREQCLHPGITAPSLVTVKDFVRFYAATSQPRLENKPTCDSINTVMEWFFAGFTRVTGTETNEQERSEIYYWVRRVLTAEGVVVNRRQDKHNFTPQDLTRILVTLWTKDDLIYIHERYRIQFTFIIRVYCWTGARLGAFFTGGLRYRDVTLVLQRISDTERWRLIYKIDQRWVKNNRDPENIVFGAAGREHDMLIYDDSAFLLSMAIADKALHGFKTLGDLRQQQIPTGKNEFVLRFREEAQNKPILRQCTKRDGVTEQPMTEATFISIFKSTLRNAGYLCRTSIHAIRRQIGKKVDELYTEVQRSQHLTQSDPRIFGQSYVANTSAVDGLGAFLGEPIDHRHIEYFQSMEQFYEPGLPCSLPTSIEEGIKNDIHLQRLEKAARKYSDKDSVNSKEAKSRLSSYLRKLKQDALQQHQKRWIQERRDRQVLTRGREPVSDTERTDLLQSLYLLFPERARLAERLTSAQPLLPEARWLAMDDLLALCTHDFSVIHLPGNKPLDNACPVDYCRKSLIGIPPNGHHQHIRSCVRREIASKTQHLQSDVQYCYECFMWVVGVQEWDDHCRKHIMNWVSKKCGSITFCHTTVRPAYCPFCLGDAALAAGQRLTSWRRDHALWKHLETHLTECWPQFCPHPSCTDVLLVDEQKLYHHFVDEHGVSRTRPKKDDLSHAVLANDCFTRSRKRKMTHSGELLWIPSDCSTPISPRKRSRASVVNLAVVPERVEKNCDTVLFVDSSDTKAVPSSIYNGSSLLTTSDIEQASNSGFRHLSCESMDVNPPRSEDEIFSKWIRSPSPEAVHCVVDNTSPDSGHNAELDSQALHSETDGTKSRVAPLDNKLCSGRPTIRIHLRVRRTTPKIKLLVAEPPKGPRKFTHSNGKNKQKKEQTHHNL